MKKSEEKIDNVVNKIHLSFYGLRLSEYYETAERRKHLFLLLIVNVWNDGRQLQIDFQ